MNETEETEALLGRLTAWGCDIPSALPRFLDDKGMYAMFVKQVVDEPSFTLLGQAIQEGDAKAAFEKAHELKGVVANMSLTPLFNRVVLIVEPLRAGKWTDVKENYALLQKEWGEFKALVQG